METREGGLRVYLDRTAFYPASGGQPSDRGELGGAAVVDVIDEGERILHILESPVQPGAVEGLVHWPRRFDYMQQHTGQHLLSAVFDNCFELPTVSVHLGEQASTIDLKTREIAPDVLDEAEAIANREVTRNRPVTVSFEDADEASGLRKASDRVGTLRVITIDGYDRSACGGTHVRATGEIGPILIRRTEKVRDTIRVEFICGTRAIEAIQRDSKTFKQQLTEAKERAAALDKGRRKLEAELSAYRGRELYEATPPGPDGIHRVLRRLPAIDDAARAEAQAFAARGPAMYLAIAGNSVFLAVSPETNRNAGAIMKQVAERGGGSAVSAQGTVADAEAAIHAILGPEFR